MSDAPTYDIVATGLRFPEGPIAMADGSVIVVEVERGTLSRIAAGGAVSVVAELGGGPNGAAIGPDGAVYVCNNGGFEWAEVEGALMPGHKPHDYAGGAIQRVDLETTTVTVLYDCCDGAPLRGPNDLVFDSSGGFWFSDHGKSTPDHRDHGALYYAKADGTHIERVRAEMLSPNGVGLSPDGRNLYVADTLSGRLWAMTIDAPGVLAPGPAWLPGRLVATLPDYQLLDSLAVDAAGNVCVGTLVNGGITVFGPDGDTRHIPLPDVGVTNICFGGTDMRDTWITGSTTGTLFHLRWPRPGLELAFNG